METPAAATLGSSFYQKDSGASRAILESSSTPVSVGAYVPTAGWRQCRDTPGQTTEKDNEAKAWFFEKVNTTDKSGEKKERT